MELYLYKRAHCDIATPPRTRLNLVGVSGWWRLQLFFMLCINLNGLLSLLLFRFQFQDVYWAFVSSAIRMRSYTSNILIKSVLWNSWLGMYSDTIVILCLQIWIANASVFTSSGGTISICIKLLLTKIAMPLCRPMYFLYML